MEFYDNFNDRWQEIRNDSFYDNFFEEIKKRFDEFRKEPIIFFTYKDYMEFFENGNRSKNDDYLIATKARLKNAFLLSLYSDEKVYIDEVCDMIWFFAGLPTWCGNAHIANDWNADFSDYRGHIDLYAAEIGYLFAEIYYFLNKKLPQEIKYVIEKELESRIFTPFESRSYWWEPKTNNWSAVCGGSVGMSYMLVCPERFGKIKPRILSCMDAFVSSYTDDGCCTEGMGYWNYGFGYYTYFADMLYRFTDGKEDIRYGDKIIKMAMFATHGYLDENIGLSFADCGRVRSCGNSGLLCYLTENYEGFSVPQIEMSIDSDLRKLMWTKKELCGKANEVPKGMYYYDKSGWYINRKEEYSFGAKSGHNGEEHNHNDIGSFIFADKETQILIDIGSMIYDRNNFNEHRYEYLHNSSLGHSVPIIDGKGQKEGREYRGTVCEVEENKFSLEIQKAYEGNLPKIIRSFELCDSGITLTDTFNDFDGHKATERFVSFIKPEVRDGAVKIGNCRLITENIPEILEVQLINHQNNLQNYYFLDYTVSGEKFSLKVEVA